MPVIREDPPEFPHDFEVGSRPGTWTTEGATRKGHVSYGRCRFCGKQYLSPHDLYTECRRRRDLGAQNPA